MSAKKAASSKVNIEPCDLQPLNDLGNGKRFASKYKESLIYCPDFSEWYEFDGTRYFRLPEAPMKQAKVVAQSMANFASVENNEELRKTKLSWAMRSHFVGPLKAMIECAKSELDKRIDLFDNHPYLFNVLNGTLDLRTGLLREHNKNDMLTQLAPVKFDKDAKCPILLDYLDWMFQGNERLIQYLQQAIGYSLTGDVSEQCIFFLYGNGANGKTTLLETIQGLLGNYAKQLTPNFLMLKNLQSHPTEIADLYKVRFATTIEPDEGCTLSESLVKWTTGNDKLKARRMRQDFWEFSPSHKLWLAANEKPNIKGADYGIWRRIRLIPCTVTVNENARDKHFREKLIAESPGILNWAIQGCLDWQHNSRGLIVPDEIQQAVDEYRSEMDILGKYIKNELAVGEGLKTRNSDLYDHYLNWCEDPDIQEQPIKKIEFTKRLAARGFESRKSTGGVYYYIGIAIKPRAVKSGVVDNSGVVSAIN